MSKIINKIFYDKKKNLVFHVKAKANKGFLCGGYAEFVNDARTNIVRMQLSANYIKRCVKILNYDSCKYIEQYEDIGWRVKGWDEF